MKTVAVLVLITVLCQAKEKKPRPDTSGVLKSKTEMTDFQILRLENRDGREFSCVLRNLDHRFNHFKPGDEMVVAGRLQPNGETIKGCWVVAWTQR